MNHPCSATKIRCSRLDGAVSARGHDPLAVELGLKTGRPRLLGLAPADGFKRLGDAALPRTSRAACAASGVSLAVVASVIGTIAFVLMLNW